MNTQDILSLQKQYLLNTYSAKLVLTQGLGARVKDNDGNDYLDFTCGISVCNLGHCHPFVTEAIQRQAAKLVHVSNLFINEVQPQLAAEIVKKSFDGRVFFGNSGAEANEGMIKFARKWGAPKDKHEIICMKHNFHGRTITTLAATDKPAIREGFEPLTSGFSFVDYNDIDALKAAITDKTAAVMLEPIQGEGGINLAHPAYMAEVRELCDEHGILMLLDEVQTGFGRTGKLFGYQNFDIVPDAMSLAKAMGNGFPMGAFVVARKWEEILGPSTHASTFGGTPLACSAALAVLKVIADQDVLANCRDMGQHLKGDLIELAQDHAIVKDVRGIGLMIGMQMESPEKATEVIAKAVDKGLLLVGAAGGVVRVYPPLNVDKAVLDQAVAILGEVLGELS